MIMEFNMKQIPTFKEYINEGALTNYRTERESMKLSYTQLSGSFDEIIKKLIEEKIPFYFDCKYKDFTRVGYLMNKTINNVNFNGYIFDNLKSEESMLNTIDEVLKEVIVEKPGKLHIGRSNFADLTKANDLETITVVVKAFKQYVKDKNITGRQITGNKYEANVNIDFLCDKTRIHDIIDYVF